MGTPPTIQIPWALKSVGIGGGECSTIDGFDGKIEEGVGKHCFPSFLEHVNWCSVLLSPKKMKRDDDHKGCQSSDDH
jgi:hypothetical protein